MLFYRKILCCRVILGFRAIDEKWKNNLELAHVILEIMSSRQEMYEKAI